jgi:hypothetical protein
MLVDPPPTQATAGSAPSFFQFLAQSVRTGIFGSQLIAQNLVRDAVQVPLVTNLPLLGFDRPWSEIRADYVSGRQCAIRRLRTTLQIKPRFIAEQLRQAVDLARARLNDIRGTRGGSAVGQLRACLLEPFGGQSLRVTQGHNMEGDADDRLTIDRRAPGAGEAFKSGDLVVMNFAAGFTPFMTKSRKEAKRARVRQGTTAIL